MNILAIDPGRTNGIAYINDGAIYELLSIPITELIQGFTDYVYDCDLIVMEDSRMQSFMFTGSKQNRAVALNMARKVGQVDCVCNMVHKLATALKKPIITISPKDKGKKLNAIDFQLVTKWTGKTNQHERDAAMVGWNYRNANLA